MLLPINTNKKVGQAFLNDVPLLGISCAEWNERRWERYIVLARNVCQVRIQHTDGLPNTYLVVEPVSISVNASQEILQHGLKKVFR